MFQKDVLTPSNKLAERNLLHKRIKDLTELQSIYELGEVLGKGSFGTVVKANHKASNVDWAIKIVNKSQAGASRLMLVEREIHILKLVNHPNIIFLDRVFESTKTIYLVFELCTRSLAKTLKIKKKFDETETLTIIRSLANALAYLHKNDIVHRDLKLENILIAANAENPDDNLHIKVTDFGLSAVRDGKGYESMLHDCCGTLTYMAPEMITTKSYSQQCDVWSMGIIMYILLVGKFPFYSTNEQQLYSLVKTQVLDFTGLSCSEKAKHLLSKMLHKNPAFRMTAAEVENHPWISGTQSKLHAHSSNVLDMMRMWKSEMMQSPEENCVNVAGDQNIRDYNNPESMSMDMISTAAVEAVTVGSAGCAITSKTSLRYKNEQKSMINESPYQKHRFWETARLSAQGSAAITIDPCALQSKTGDPLIISIGTNILHASVSVIAIPITSTSNDRSTEDQYRANETTERSAAEPMIAKKQRAIRERRRFQSSAQLPDFSHIPAKVDSNLATLRREGQVQRKRGYIRNRNS